MGVKIDRAGTVAGPIGKGHSLLAFGDVGVYENEEFALVVHNCPVLEKPAKYRDSPEERNPIFAPAGILDDDTADDDGVAVIDQQFGSGLLGANRRDILDGSTEVSGVPLGYHLQSDLTVRSYVRCNRQR